MSMKPHTVFEIENTRMNKKSNFTLSKFICVNQKTDKEIA